MKIKMLWHGLIAAERKTSYFTTYFKFKSRTKLAKTQQVYLYCPITLCMEAHSHPIKQPP